MALEREIAIMRLICMEYSNKEISERMNMGTRNVEGYGMKILEKTNARSVAGVVVYAIEHGYFKTGE